LPKGHRSSKSIAAPDVFASMSMYSRTSSHPALMLQRWGKAVGSIGIKQHSFFPWYHEWVTNLLQLDDEKNAED